MKRLVTRYEEGECEAVWRELRVLGEAVQDTREAHMIAKMTMERLRHNVNLIYERLQSLGYQFEHPGTACLPPAADIEEQIAAVEEKIGRKLPLSLRYLHTVVGTVDF